jgi:hypothetical protein
MARIEHQGRCPTFYRLAAALGGLGVGDQPAD